MTENWQPPRCGHGYILLACPYTECPEQNEHLNHIRQTMAAYNDRMRQAAVELVREALHLPDDWELGL